MRAKTICIILVILISTACLSTVGFAEGEQSLGANTTVDFVLVLDCSGSLRTTDPHYLCSTACKMFLDMVPLENARIGIIAFGYADGSQYTLESQSIANPYDLKKVHLVSPLEEATALREKEGIKDTIDTAVQRAGDKTPIGTATLAAIDLLESSGSANGSACVILLTDGNITADQSYISDGQNAHSATASAKEHNWPIYTIQLNDGGRNGEHADSTKLMKSIAIESGAGEEAYSVLDSFVEGNTDVAQAFLNIFNRFMFGGEGNIEVNQADENGIVERKIPIPELTSETTIVISGNSLETVDVINPEGTSRSISSEIDEQNIVASIETGNYICIKLLCPAEGEWTVRAHGDPNATIAMYDCSMKDLDLVLNTSLADPTAILSKNDSVTFNSYFSYHDIELLTSSYYQKKQPMLVVTNTETNQKREFPMNASNNGYSLPLSMNEIGEGTFTAAVRLDDDMFRNGSKWSNDISLKTKNLPVEITDPKLPALNGYINGKFETIDLMKYIKNPDGDPLEFAFECSSDRTVTFDYTIDENNYLYIDCGTVAGTYEIQFSVKDGDMTEFLQFNPMVLTVENRPFEYSQVPDVEVWLDAYSWQEAGQETAEINLNDYYYDPDGMPLQISEMTFTGGDELYQSSLDGTVLHLAPLSKGEGTISFVVSDGSETQDMKFSVSVVSGKAIFWADNWIYFLIALILLIIILITILTIVKNTRVKGSWEIEFYDDTGKRLYVPIINIRSNTNVGRKKKCFEMRELVEELKYIAENEGDMAGALFQYPEILGLKLKGVSFGSGCKILNISKQGNVTASCNGLPATSKVKLGAAGYFEMTVNSPDAPQAKFKMRYLASR